MKKTEIFEDIVSIMKNDASCCKDMQGDDPTLYGNMISEEMSESDFLYVIRSYLASFGITGHLSINSDNEQSIAIRVQKYQDELYVKAAMKESPLQVGDRITHIDGMMVKEYYESRKKLFLGESEERQGRTWTSVVLKKANKLTYVNAQSGEIKECDVPYTAEWKSSEEPYFCKNMGEGIVYMRLADFLNQEAINKMFEDNQALLAECEKLIVDVRANGGGYDTAFFPLFTYCLENGKHYEESKEKDTGCLADGQEILYTERNCDERLKLFKEVLQQDLPKETLDYLNESIKALEKYRGAGFVKEENDNEAEAEDLPFVGDSKVKKVYILVDELCASSGDSFAYYFALLPKVKLVGRPTFGILDYSNCIELKYDQYEFLYPTSRLCSLDHGEGMMKRGVPVDVYIPWTPEQLQKDVILDKALEMCRK